MPLASATLSSLEQWEDWQWQVRNRITTVSELEKWVSLTVEEKRAIHFSQDKFLFSLTPYWASIMDPTDFLCPIRRQAIPLDEEFRTSIHEVQDLSNEGVKLAGGRLTHFYPDRAVLSIHDECSLYCRFCPQRKIKSKDKSLDFTINERKEWEEMTQYLLEHPQINEIILSGGEPLLLNDDSLQNTLSRLKEIPSIKNLRIESRIISTLPQRITSSLINILREYQPLYFMIHVNHPREITQEFSRACAGLVDSGIPLVSNTVLLREINDKPQILAELFSQLVKLRIRPYRLVQMLPAQGTEHFRTTVSAGLRLIENLRGRLTGLALPEYVVDTGGGKVPLRYDSILSRNKKRLLLKNYEGKVFVYPEKVFTFSY